MKTNQLNLSSPIIVKGSLDAMNAVDIVILREPKVKDILGLNTSNMTIDEVILLISRCSNLTVDQVESLSIANYEKICARLSNYFPSGLFKSINE